MKYLIQKTFQNLITKKDIIKAFSGVSISSYIIYKTLSYKKKTIYDNNKKIDLNLIEEEYRLFRTGD